MQLLLFNKFCSFFFFKSYLRKFFLTLKTGSKVHVHWKGAAEIILASCTQYVDLNGSMQPIDEDMVGSS